MKWTYHLLLLLGFVACGRGVGRDAHWPAPTSATRPPPAPVLHPAASFEALDSPRILKAALQYPASVLATEPPLSLTASDGTGLALTRLTARAWIDGPLAFTELHLSFKNPEPRRIEGRFRITLPEGAAVSRLAMRLPSGLMEAEVVERQKAQRVYEDFLHRAQDPALLEQAAGNEFSARVFPIEADAEKDLIIAYSEELPRRDSAYTLPLRGLPQIGELSVTAFVREPGAAAPRRLGLERTRYVPDADFTATSQGAADALRSGDVAVVRVRPTLTATPAPLSSLDVLFDTSASRAPGFAAEVARLAALLGQLAAQDPALTVRVLAFNQTTTALFAGPASSFGDAAHRAVLAQRPLGASDLGQALGALGPSPAERVLVITDGVPTAGATEGDALRKAVSRLRGKVRRLDVVVSGGLRDSELMTRLARGVLEQDGVVLSGETAAPELAARLRRVARSGIRVALPGAKWVWPETLDGVQPGDERLVYASLTPDAPRPGAPLVVELDDAGQRQEVRVTPRTSERPLLVRAVAQAEIARLTRLRDELPEGRTAERARLVEEIVDLSTRLRVLSDYTALLVLETEEDYARYGIARHALADILTVGSERLELLHRADLVVAADAATERGSDEASALDADEPAEQAAPPISAEAAEPDGAKKDVAIADERELRPRAPAGAPAPARAPHRSRRAAGGAPAPASAAEAADESRSEEPAPGEAEQSAASTADEDEGVPEGPPPLVGRLASIVALIQQGASEQAVVEALAWHNEDFGDVMALIGLGEALEARGQVELAARAYGSIIDLFPDRADLRRFAGNRLDRLGKAAAPLAIDTYAKAVAQRPDHLTGHRLLAYALVRAGHYRAALDALERGLVVDYPDGRFASGERILTEDLGLVAAAWARAEPGARAAIEARLAKYGLAIPSEPSLRFVLTWETDANDVDFHIYDRKRNHAYYGSRELASGGALYDDVTTGYGPECFAIAGEPRAFPYWVRLHYYSRGPMGYGMGKLEIVRHDGRGNLTFEQRPFVVMQDEAYVDLGLIEER